MCLQCVTSASVAASAGATGLLAWFHARGPAWLTGSRMKAATVGVVLLGVVAAGVQP